MSAGGLRVFISVRIQPNMAHSVSKISEYLEIVLQTLLAVYFVTRCKDTLLKGHMKLNGKLGALLKKEKTYN